jgi:hypothetical protein
MSLPNAHSSNSISDGEVDNEDDTMNIGDVNVVDVLTGTQGM